MKVSWLIVVMGLVGASPAFGACGYGLYEVVINELVANPDGTDAGAEWVELLNIDPYTTVDLEGWTLEVATHPEESDASTAGYRTAFTLPERSLAPGERLVVAGDAAGLSGSDVLVIEPSGSLPNASSGSDAVRLVDCDGWVQDVVAYGASNTPGEAFLDEWGLPVPSEDLAPSPASGLALARIPDGTDSDVPALDFSVVAATPGLENVGVTDATCEQAGVPGDVVINELMVNPAGADGEAANEWVELYGVSGQVVQLSGWTLSRANRADADGVSASVRFTFPQGATLAPGAHLVVGGELSAADLTTSGFDLYSGAGGDAVILSDCEGTGIDTVVYGGPNEDLLSEDDGHVPDEGAPRPGNDEVLARRADGLDSDRSVADFLLLPEGTPGLPNEDLQCRDAGAPVKINEFLPDPAGTDSDVQAEWVELVSSEVVDLAGWTLHKASRVDEHGAPEAAHLFTFPSGASIAPGEFLVVGGVRAEVVDLVAVSFDLYGGSGGDAVILRDCLGRRADALLYGGRNEDALAEDDGAVPDVVADDPQSNQCLARRIDGADSDVSADDLMLTTHCSPGATNGDPVPAAGGGTTLPPRGCGQPVTGGPVALDPEGGCRFAPERTHAAGWLLVVALTRRRRRARGRPFSHGAQ